MNYLLGASRRRRRGRGDDWSGKVDLEVRSISRLNVDSCILSKFIVFFLAQRVTNETYRWVSDARFHPSGSKVIATKWYTTSRSLAAGEGWEYSVPDTEDIHHEVQVGSGERLVGKTLPSGWDADQYGDQQIGPEQFIWKGNDSLIYSMNVADTDGEFEYSKGVSFCPSH